MSISTRRDGANCLVKDEATRKNGEEKPHSTAADLAGSQKIAGMLTSANSALAAKAVVRLVESANDPTIQIAAACNRKLIAR